MPEMVDIRYFFCLAFLAILAVMCGAIFLHKLDKAEARIAELEEELEIERGLADVREEEKGR
jgi:hypothetical protein